MSKSKKVDLISLIVFGVLAVSVIMAIVGVCIAWISTSVESIAGNSEPTTSTLADLAKANSEQYKLTQKNIDGFVGMQAFAYITLVLSALTAIVFVVSKFVDVKVLKFVVLGVSALLIVSAIITIALSFSFCSDYKVDVVIAKSKTVPAAGVWLLSIFSILGGGAGVIGALKK